MADASRASNSPSGDDSGDDRDETMQDGDEPHTASGNAAGNGPTANPKDPSRPRRKKARRACLACQRAHLTCGDERPCQRCIKRGLADHCQDGFRKKAKYLHDAPNEALIPGIVTEYSNQPNTKEMKKPQDSSSPAANSPSTFRRPSYMQQLPQPGYDAYHSQMQMAARVVSHDPPLLSPYGTQPSPISSQYGPQQSPSINVMSNPMANPMATQPSPSNASHSQPFSGLLLDANDPSSFNIDIASMNFGNHYGALEFGALGQMSSGAHDNFMHSNQRTMSSSTGYDTGAGGYEDPTSLAFGDNDRRTQGFSVQNYPNYSRDTGSISAPFAYSIGAGQPVNSPGSIGSDMSRTYDNSIDPVSISSSHQHSQSYSTRKHSDLVSESPRPSSRDGPLTSVSNKLQSQHFAVAKKRRRDPTTIYDSIKQPYPYTTAFHTLTALVRRRFSSQKRLKIAKALGQIRPSFISCTRELVDMDLLFMEKWFQRSLLQYEDYITAQGSPTIVCRRTGEVAYVGKEFSLLTGWRKDVLLGREPNLNVNTGGGAGASGLQTGSSTKGFNTPRVPEATGANGPTSGPTSASAGLPVEPTRPQPVFLAELLEDDDVVQFYEDFAKVAFADSRVTRSRRCMVLKYKTRHDPGWGGDQSTTSGEGDKVPPDSSGRNDSNETNGRKHGRESAGNLKEEERTSESKKNTSSRKRNIDGTDHHSKDHSRNAPNGRSSSSHAGSTTADRANGTSSVPKSTQSHPAPGKSSSHGRSHSSGNTASSGDPIISAEQGMYKLGDKDGKVDCMCTWTVKRDLFDMPMMIVFNFLPVI